MSNKSHRLYVGWTTDLNARVCEHRDKGYPDAFTARYRFDRLVWFEVHPTHEGAWRREHQIKGWVRSKKVALIQAANPNWLDLNRELHELLRLD
jgi:putative endonuclease